MKTNLPESNQEFLQRLRTKIRNHEISEKEVISLLEEKKLVLLSQLINVAFVAKNFSLQHQKKTKKLISKQLGLVN